MSHPRLRSAFLFLAAALPTSAAARADVLDAGVSIDLEDESHIRRTGELVSVSVPLAETAGVLDPSQLWIGDVAGQELVVQWRVLTRWRGAPDQIDRPIRFALARFLVDLGPNEKRSVLLRRRKAADGDAPQTGPSIETELTNGSWCSVTTGPARFDLHPSRFTLFHNVFLDLDLDGEFEPDAGERIMTANDAAGPLLVDRFDGIYAGATDPDVSMWIEESGPLMLVVIVEGKHAPVGKGHIGRDFLKYRTRLTFVAGSSAVLVDHTLANSYLTKPLGAIGFARYFLHSKIDVDGPVRVRFGGDPDVTIHEVVPVAGEEAVLLQDSAGGSNWSQPGTTFRGFRVYRAPTTGVRPEAPPAVQPVAQGERSTGWMDVRSGGRGVMVALRHPWQNYPFALRAHPSGHFLTDLLPSEHADPFWLDDAQQKSWELVYEFHGPGFQPAPAAGRFARPLRPIVPASYLRVTKAWGDLGDLRDPGLTKAEMRAYGKEELAKIYNSIDTSAGFGWADFGEPTWAKNTHTTGSPRNRLTYFDRFVQSGSSDWFEKEEIFVRHSMHLRTYHVDEFLSGKHDTYLPEGLPHWSSPDQLGRDAIPASLAKHKEGIPEKGHGWNGFDAGHMTVDDLYDYYVLTGSPDALRSLRQIGEALLTWPSIDASKAQLTSRIAGWPLRALVKCYQASGDARFLAQADELFASIDNHRGKAASPKTGHVYHYLTRQTYDKDGHGMVFEYDLPWQMAVGIYGIALYGRESGKEGKAGEAIADLSNYIVDFATINGVVVEALACDDHLDNNPKVDNTGVNSWLASALAVSWRVTKRAETLDVARKIFLANKHGYENAGGTYHWYHTAGVVLGL